MQTTFSEEELHRYNRHFIMPEVGEEGQGLLKAARVLIVGAGGLGSPVALYLTAAGVGTIGIVDFDVVDASNLQRQVLHSTGTLGKKKTESAREHLNKLNPFVTIHTYQTILSSVNAPDIIKEYDIVVDGSDNFPTRYLINDACMLGGKPFVYGSVFRFEGQLSVFMPHNGPCYRCLYPIPPKPEMVQNCSEAGVLGVLPGIIGTLQALEVIKFILGNKTSGKPLPELLTGKLLLFDGLTTQFHTIQIKENPDCPLCGTHPTINHLIDYDEFCGMEKAQHIDIHDITPEELKLYIDNGKEVLIVDVREPNEYAYSNIGGILIPLRSLPEHIDSLPRDKELVLLCHHGIRSAFALELLLNKGFTKVKNLVGGIDAWSMKIDPKVPRY